MIGDRYSLFNPTLATKIGVGRSDCLIVAHNIAFDMLHLMRESPGFLKYMEEGEAIWDTMIVEYLLTGQETKWASLDDLSLKYGGTVKDNRIKEYWNNGISTEDIPEEEILPYLEQDVRNLKIIYEAQLKEAHRLSMMPLIESQMSARQATIMMEYNGMYFDTERATELSKSVEGSLNNYEDALRAAMRLIMPDVPYSILNPNSTAQISTTLFGGEVNYKGVELVLDEEGKQVFYKSGAKKGQMKTKIVDKVCKIEQGLFSPPAKFKKGVNGYYPVGDEILKRLEDSSGFVDTLRKYRELSKQVGTYFEGYSALVWPHDSCIHGTLNHCQTNTGRLSSSNPNLQNINNKDVGAEE